MSARGLVCQVCHSPIVYGGRGRYPKFCSPGCAKAAPGWMRDRHGRRIGRTCEFCHGAFTQTRGARPHRFCSKSCDDWSRRKVLECNGCGEEFTPKVNDRDSYCSRECAFEAMRGPFHPSGAWAKHEAEVRTEIERRYCDRCHCAVSGHATRLYCDGCRYQVDLGFTRRRLARLHEPEPFDCAECGGTHVPEYGDTRTRYCSDDCQRRAVKRNGRHRRRQRMSSVRGRRVDRAEIWKRDRGRCQLCGESVPQSVHHLHPRAATMDHVVPLAMGGAHIPSNVQLAHRECNVAKGAGSMGSQLRIAL